MSATGTPTPNIGLRIPLGTDPASVDDINYNSNLIDTKLGAVGNDSVQDQLDDLNSNITTINSKFGQIQVSGNTDSGGNRIVASRIIKVISVICNGYLPIVFHNSGNTYLKILNFGTMEPVANTAIEATVVTFEDTIPQM